MRTIKPLALYIHIPFCQRKCLYCDFISFPGGRERFPAYLQALGLELGQRLKAELEIASIYIGGGTPTVLPTEALTELLKKIKAAAQVLPNAEITIEANPGSVTKEQLALLFQAGVNRLSLGAQSGKDRFLKKLGRGHTTRQVETTFATARKVGFSNINLDLIFGLPEETIVDWTETLKWATALGPEHLSCYGLQVEEGTPLAKMLNEGRISLPSEDEVSAMFLLNAELLPSVGYRHYEISNFAKIPSKSNDRFSDYRCRHNLFYWQYADYLGLGLAAYSSVAGRRWGNLSDLNLYLNALRSGKLPVAVEEMISPAKGMAEMIMLGLRLIDGPDPTVFKARWGVSLDEVLGSRVEPLLTGGFLLKKQGTYCLTPRGMLVSNQVLTELLNPLL